MNRGIKAAMAAGAAVLVVCACARKTVVLEYRFRKGEELGYVLKSRGEGTVRMPDLGGDKPPADVASKIDMELSYRMVVGNTDAQGNADIETLFDGFTMAMESGGMKVRMEADAKGARVIQGDTVIKDAPGLDELKALFRNPTVMKMDRRGKVLSITQPGGAAAVLPHADLYAFLKENQFVLPEGPIAVGHSWREQRDVALTEGTGIKLGDGRRLTLDMSYTLAGIASRGGRSCAEIAMAGTLDAKDLALQTPQGGMSGMTAGIVFDTLRQKTTGNIHFDLERGRLLDARVETEIEQQVTRRMKPPGEERETKLTTGAKMKMLSELKLNE